MDRLGYRNGTSGGRYLKKTWAITAVVLVWIMLSASVASVSVQAQRNTANTTTAQPNVLCASALQSEQLWTNTHLDQAILVAQASQAFKSIASSFEKVTFSTSHITGRWGADCVSVNETFNTVFSATNASGFQGWIVVSESPATLSVINVSTQMHPGYLDYCSSSPCNNPIWAGYEAGNTYYDPGCGCNRFNPANFVYAEWYEPGLYYPPTGCANYYECNLAVWVGLEQEQGGTNHHLAQAGTGAWCSLGSGYCGSATEHDFIYDLIPQEYVMCDTLNGNVAYAGDEVTAYTEAATDSNGNTNYQFYIDDVTNGAYCLSPFCNYPCYNNAGLIGSDNRAAIEVENFEFCYYDCDSLAQFDTTTFHNAGFSDPSRWSYVGQANWIMRDNMNNCNTPNVSTSGITGPNQDLFSETWLSSQNTPYWNTGC